ncbi:MAG: hypothetical protein OHK0048_04900 [Rhodoferax sp.]
MDVSSTAMVNATALMQQAQVVQTAQAQVLKKALDSQAVQVQTLLKDLPLATSGSLGTRLNTMA